MEKVRNILNLIFSSLLALCGFGFFIYLGFTAAISQQTANNSYQIVTAPVIESSVYDAIKYLNEKEFSHAIEIIDNKITLDSSIDAPIREYFANFKSYCEQISNPLKPECEFDTSYFILNSFRISNYLQQNCHYSKPTARMLSETIPYFLIQVYDQTQKNRSKLFNFYIQTFTGEGGLSEKTADIICLYFQALFNENKNNVNFFRYEITTITNYRNVLFERELGENGIYENQRIYLMNLSNYLEKVANQKITWLKLESSPKFTL